MIIQTDNIWKKYGRFDALQGLSIAVPEGSTFALIGANGAGKSTTIKVLMNLISPSRGNATILGVESRKISPRELAQIGYVSENQELPGYMTVAGYLAYIQVPGHGMRVAAKDFSRALLKSASMRTTMFHYAHALFNQVAQSAACAHFHSLEQRCCRWLLMTQERMQDDEFLLTQEFLAMMLGVRRAGVSVAMGALKRAGLLRYERGEVTILDHHALEAQSCECYQVTKKEFDRLLGDIKTVSSASKKRAAKSQALRKAR